MLTVKRFNTSASVLFMLSAARELVTLLATGHELHGIDIAPFFFRPASRQYEPCRLLINGFRGTVVSESFHSNAVEAKTFALCKMLRMAYTVAMFGNKSSEAVSGGIVAGKEATVAIDCNSYIICGIGQELISLDHFGKVHSVQRLDDFASVTEMVKAAAARAAVLYKSHAKVSRTSGVKLPINQSVSFVYNSKHTGQLCLERGNRGCYAMSGSATFIDLAAIADAIMLNELSSPETLLAGLDRSLVGLIVS